MRQWCGIRAARVGRWAQYSSSRPQPAHVSLHFDYNRYTTAQLANESTDGLMPPYTSTNIRIVFNIQNF